MVPCALGVPADSLERGSGAHLVIEPPGHGKGGKGFTSHTRRRLSRECVDLVGVARIRGPVRKVSPTVPWTAVAPQRPS